MDSRITLKQIVEDNTNRYGRMFDLFIQILIILSLISFSIDTLPDLSEQTRYLLDHFQIVTVTIFSMEYLLRIAVADRKRDYIFSLYGIIDLLAILPFYLSAAIDLRSLRALRLFRLFRLLKLTRYSRAMVTYKKALSAKKEEFVLFALATVFMLYVSAVGIYYFENAAQPDQYSSIFHSLWWAVATLTTVGYGDVYPVTIGGKLFTFLILMVGLGIVGVPAGLISDALKDED